MNQSKKTTRIIWLTSSIQELANEIATSEGSGADELSPEEIVRLASNIILNKDHTYKPVLGRVNKDEVFFEMIDGSYQPLFEVPDDEDTLPQD